MAIFFSIYFTLNMQDLSIKLNTVQYNISWRGRNGFRTFSKKPPLTRRGLCTRIGVDERGSSNKSLARPNEQVAETILTARKTIIYAGLAVRPRGQRDIYVCTRCFIVRARTIKFYYAAHAKILARLRTTTIIIIIIAITINNVGAENESAHRSRSCDVASRTYVHTERVRN